MSRQVSVSVKHRSKRPVGFIGPTSCNSDRSVFYWYTHVLLSALAPTAPVMPLSWMYPRYCGMVIAAGVASLSALATTDYSLHELDLSHDELERDFFNVDQRNGF